MSYFKDHKPDFCLGPHLEDALFLGLPSTIWNVVFKTEEELCEIEQGILMSAIVDAAIWGAKNNADVWMFVSEKEKRMKEVDDYNDSLPDDE